MKAVKVINGKFEAELSHLEDGRVRISFIVPERQEGFNPDDYTHLVEHMISLAKNKDGKYVVEYQGLDSASAP